MDKPTSKFYFKSMVFAFKLRDLFFPRANILKEIGIKPRFYVLDYGCGPGSYIKATSKLVGKSGKIYALDIHPLAIQRVRNIASNNQITNIETICSSCETGLPDSTIDVVLLYDIFHLLSDSVGVLYELHRVLKPNGILSFGDHHMKESKIIPKVTNNGLFQLLRKGKKTYSFSKL